MLQKHQLLTKNLLRTMSMFEIGGQGERHDTSASITSTHFKIVFFRSRELLFIWKICYTLGKTHIKKVFFLEVGPLRFYPPYTNGLVVHATFLYIIPWNGFWQKKISPIFGVKKAKKGNICKKKKFWQILFSNQNSWKFGLKCRTS